MVLYYRWCIKGSVLDYLKGHLSVVPGVAQVYIIIHSDSMTPAALGINYDFMIMTQQKIGFPQKNLANLVQPFDQLKLIHI